MADLHGFDANQVDPAADFEPIPAGKYLAIITESETKPTKSGNGSYLELTFEIIEGEFNGRKLWSRLNLDNPSEMAVKIAYGQLSAICRAAGVMTPKDSYELHNIPLQISVKCRKRSDNDEIVNEIRGFSKKAAANGRPQQAVGNVPPWARK